MAVLVERGHEVEQGPGHPELDLEEALLVRDRDQACLVADRNDAEESGGLHGPVLAAGAIGQRNHNGLEALGDDFELANALELHGLAGDVLGGRGGVCEDVENIGAVLRQMYSEVDHIRDHHLAIGSVAGSGLFDQGGKGEGGRGRGIDERGVSRCACRATSGSLSSRETTTTTTCRLVRRTHPDSTDCITKRFKLTPSWCSASESKYLRL